MKNSKYNKTKTTDSEIPFKRKPESILDEWQKLFNYRKKSWQRSKDSSLDVKIFLEFYQCNLEKENEFDYRLYSVHLWI